MSCGLSLEKLKDFDKQLDDQVATLGTQIQQLENQLATAKNTYLKVIGAKEMVTIQIKEAEDSQEAVNATVPEASGD